MIRLSREEARQLAVTAQLVGAGDADLDAARAELEALAGWLALGGVVIERTVRA